MPRRKKIQPSQDDLEDQDTTKFASQSFGIEQAMDNLFQKRSSAREDGYVSLNKELISSYLIDIVSKREGTLLEAIKSSLKKGSGREVVLACKSICLINITLGTSGSGIYIELKSLLISLIKHSKDSSTRSASLEALGLSCFIGAEEPIETQECAELCYELVTSEKESLVLSQALNTLSLLQTTLPFSYIYKEIIPRCFKTIVKHLSDSSVEVRIAAGECIAVLCSLYCQKHEDEYNLEEAFGSLIDTDDLMESLRQLANDPMNQFSKKDKNKQKQIFKDIFVLFESGDEAEETLTLKHQKFTFDTWTTLKQLRYIRSILGGGLQVHFEENYLLSEIFDIKINRDESKHSMSKKEKRKYMSSNSSASRNRSKQKNIGRRNKDPTSRIFSD